MVTVEVRKKKLIVIGYSTRGGIAGDLQRVMIR